MDDERRLRVLLRRDKAIRERVDGPVKKDRWHIEHHDRVKREIDQLARKLDK